MASPEETFQRLVAKLDYPMFIATVAADGELAELFGGETGDEVDKFDRCEWRPGPWSSSPSSRRPRAPASSASTVPSESTPATKAE
jgi:hypothetical protein